MPTKTVTDEDRETVILDSGTVSQVTLTKVPTQYDNDYLCIENGQGVTIFNMHIATSAVSAGSILFSGSATGENIFLKNIPAGCEIEMEFEEVATPSEE